MQGHPLAIKLTAALMTSRSLTSIRDELRRNPPKGVSERFDVSYKSLAEGQRDLFCRLAVFSGSMTEEAAGEICIDEDLEGRSDWQSDLGELERRSFLDRIEIEAQDESGNEVTLYRYRMHPLMRQYAAGKAGDDLLARLRLRAAEYFLGYALNFFTNFSMLDLEHENILAGMDWAVEQQKSSSCEAQKAGHNRIQLFMLALDRYLDVMGYWTEYHRRLHQAIEAAEILDDRKQEAIWVRNLGSLAQNMGDNTVAKRLHLQSLTISEKLGDMIGIARSLHHLGMLAQATGQYAEARQLYQQSLKIKQDLGDKSGVSSSLHNFGALAQATGDYNEARNLYQQSMKIKQELDDKSGMAKSFHILGILAKDAKNYEEARELYRQSMKILRDLSDKNEISKLLHNLGALAQDISDYEEARNLYQKSMEISKELGDRSGVAGSLHQMGTLAYLTSDYNEARNLCQQSLAIFLELGERSRIASSQAQLSMLEEKMGNAKAALQLIRQAEATFLDLGSPFAEQARKDRERIESNR